jgi:hemoglobin
MKPRVVPVVLLASSLLIGCGGGGRDEPRDFSTSGNREADQRAEQRMAKHEQIRGDKSGEEKDKQEKQSLYDRLGGEEGITMIVDDFINRAIADPRVNWERKGIRRGGVMGIGDKSVEWQPSGDNVTKLKKHMVQFITLSSGGPTKYEGGEMKQVHQGMKITNAEFDAAIGDLKATLDSKGVGAAEQKELLAIFESTRAQVAEAR